MILVCIDRAPVKAAGWDLCDQPAAPLASPHPPARSHWPTPLASGLFCRIFYQNIGNGHRHVPSNVGWLDQLKAVTSAPFPRLEVTLE